jgi:hypothetical protein
VSTSDITRRCTECGNPIRVMAFLDDPTCSVDCANTNAEHEDNQ